jgi:hypothetical protein
LLRSFNDPASRANRVASRVVAAVCLAFAAVLVFGVTQTPEGPGQVVGLLLAVAFAGAGVFLLVLPRISPPKSRPTHFVYALYPGALALRRGAEWVVVRWDEVAEHRGPRPGVAEATLVTRDGREWPLSGKVVDSDLFFHEVEHRAAAAVAEQALQAVGEGQEVAFGEFVVGRAGLTWKGKAIAWDDIDTLAVTPLRRRGGGYAGGIQGLGPHLQVVRAGAAWCAEPFLPLPNRAALLNVLSRRLPPKATVVVEEAIGLFRPEPY